MDKDIETIRAKNRGYRTSYKRSHFTPEDWLAGIDFQENYLSVFEIMGVHLERIRSTGNRVYLIPIYTKDFHSLLRFITLSTLFHSDLF